MEYINTEVRVTNTSSFTNSDFIFGLDRFRTEFGGYMIIVKIMIPSNSGIKISQIRGKNDE